jgi:hypothetical protein
MYVCVLQMDPKIRISLYNLLHQVSTNRKASTAILFQIIQPWVAAEVNVEGVRWVIISCIIK